MLSITVSPGLQLSAETGESNLTSLSCQTKGGVCPLLPNSTYLAFSIFDMLLSGMVEGLLDCDSRQATKDSNGADLVSDQHFPAARPHQPLYELQGVMTACQPAAQEVRATACNIATCYSGP